MLSVPWSGVRLSDLLDAAGVAAAARALTFTSFDGADTESLTLDQARRADVIVATECSAGRSSETTADRSASMWRRCTATSR